MIQVELLNKDKINIDKKEIAKFWTNKDVLDIKSLPTTLEADNIVKQAKFYRDNFNSMLIVGCGANSIPTKSFYDILPHDRELIFIENMLDEEYLQELFSSIKNKKFCVNIISRSCKTKEILSIMERLEKTGFSDFLLTVCEDSKNNLSDKLSKYKTLFVKTNFSGRFSNFTEYVMFPLAFAGIDIMSLRDSCKKSFENYLNTDASPFVFSLAQKLYSQKKPIEVLSTFNQKLTNLFDWYIQLYMESLSKNQSGTFYSTTAYPNDLHFKEQYYIEGSPNFYEVLLEYSTEQQSKLFNATKKSVILAHLENQIPIIKLTLPHINTDSLGEIIAFIQTSCMFRAYLENINCFNQPGVEAYKSNIQKFLK